MSTLRAQNFQFMLLFPVDEARLWAEASRLSGLIGADPRAG